MIKDHRIATKEDWIKARKALLAKERQFTHLRDQLSAERRKLPWRRVEKNYVFDGPDGKESLSRLFGKRHQLVIYHFMFAPEDDVGCKSCSFWADSFNGIVAHLDQRDVTFAAISRAPLAKLQGLARRLGWSFKWLSAGDSDFNYDFNVSFKPEEAAGNLQYNYAPVKEPNPDLPGVSVFFKDDEGTIYHTYSAYARGIDMLNTAYNYLDLVPKGRDEADLPHTMAWVRHRDLYER